MVCNIVGINWRDFSDINAELGVIEFEGSTKRLSDDWTNDLTWLMDDVL